jgi:hypothetical protein
VSAGEPVEQGDDLFGVSVNIARQLCEQAAPGQILMTDGVRELAVGKGFRIVERGRTRLSGFDGPVGLYEVDWRGAETGRREAAVAGPNSAEPEIGERPTDPGVERRRGRPAPDPPAPAGLWYRVRRHAAEMKRRKVFRVAAAYLAAGFVVVEAASLVVEPLNLPSWSYTLILILTALGFPLAVILAWAYEITPDGSVRPGGVAGERRRVPSEDV